MGYYRPLRVDELTEWLLEKFGGARGFGEILVDAEELAQKLVENFDVAGSRKTAL